MPRTTLHFFRWLITVLLMVCLPLQAISASVAGMLGARHSHELVRGSEAGTVDPMAGWLDFRRVQHDHLVEASASAATHTRMHAQGSRHHHERSDASVVKQELSGLDDGPGADGAQASAAFIFMAAPVGARIAPATESIGANWRSAGSRPPGHPFPWRIERPPQATLPSVTA